jgi:hypothetical protein
MRTGIPSPGGRNDLAALVSEIQQGSFISALASPVLMSSLA